MVLYIWRDSGYCTWCSTVYCPKPADNAIARRFSQISAGSYHTLAVSSQGKVYAWGWNGNSQVGTGTTTDTAVPTLVQVADTPMEGKTITQVSAGGHFDVGHSAALASDGTVYTWGANDYGQLGDGTNTRALKPVKVALPAGTVVTKVVTGRAFSAVLTANNEIYAWGFNNHGQLGNGSAANSNVPVLANTNGIMAGKTIVDIDSGSTRMLALTSDGAIYAWGRGNTFQLGDGAQTDRYSPEKVSTLAGVTFTKIAASGGFGSSRYDEMSHSLALASDGKLYSLGFK